MTDVENDAGRGGRVLARLDFTLTDLPRIRTLLRAAADDLNLDETRVDHLVIAVNEAATNAIRYAGGSGSFEMIRVDGRRIAAIISDRGPGVRPVVPTQRPGPEAVSGRGMWLMHHLCDRVAVSVGPHGGTTVRLEMHIPES